MCRASPGSPIKDDSLKRAFTWMRSTALQDQIFSMRFDDFGGIDSLKRLNESIVLHNLMDRMNLLVSGFPSLPVDVVCLPELTDI